MSFKTQLEDGATSHVCLDKPCYRINLIFIASLAIFKTMCRRNINIIEQSELGIGQRNMLIVLVVFDYCLQEPESGTNSMEKLLASSYMFVYVYLYLICIFYISYWSHLLYIYIYIYVYIYIYLICLFTSFFASIKLLFL